ncbi:zinc ribbon domain-containing protein [Polaribacter sargassicola]|uniref:zinc ribbon domain-containing protein n=1 Tax=Polaribacter sargassicola TaxID=2836891 RepID=UPI001F408146|nr:zinc ribbon domain-containing protein [Polaribacter sp. DS7-9]MCG1035260.1 GTP-binding protein [Polaribacter sp. DS7-9]
MSSQIQNYKCPKCNNRSYTVDQMRATGGTFSKIFDIQNKKFTSVTCNRCTYTEFYKTKTSAISNVFDFFTN